MDRRAGWQVCTIIGGGAGDGGVVISRTQCARFACEIRLCILPTGPNWPRFSCTRTSRPSQRRRARAQIFEFNYARGKRTRTQTEDEKDTHAHTNEHSHTHTKKHPTKMGKCAKTASLICAIVVPYLIEMEMARERI